MKIAEIRVGERHRKDLGDIDALARSIAEIGLLHPVVVRPDGLLIAGERRLAACKLLGWDDVPVTEIDLDVVMRGEHDENVLRKDFTPSEAVAIGVALEPMEREAASARMVAAHASPEKFTELNWGNALDKVASAVGMSRPTYEKAKAVVDAARENPAEWGSLVQQMDDTGKVDAAYRAMKHREARESVAEQARNAPQVASIRKMDALAFLRETPRASVDLLLTDPPYMTDVPDVEAFARSWVPPALDALKTTGRAYVCTGAYPEELSAYLQCFGAECAKRSFTLANVLVWAYENTLGPAPKYDYKLNWQAIFYLRGPDAAPLDCPLMIEQFSVQHLRAPDGRLGDRYHAWQKPDELAERLVRHGTKAGDLVLDPFAGTGTFVLAAARLGRYALGCDSSEEMLTIARARGCDCE